MLMKKGRSLSGMAALAGPLAIPTSLEGVAIAIYGSTCRGLSDAVDAAHARDERLHVNNSTLSSIKRRN